MMKTCIWERLEKKTSSQEPKWRDISHSICLQLLDLYHRKYRNLLKSYKSRKDDPVHINRIELFKADGQKFFYIAACKCTGKTCLCERMKKYTTTGDGILSSLQVIRAVLHSGKKASELSDEIVIYPQVLKNARVANENKNKYGLDEEIKKAFSDVDEKLGNSGRLLVRPSGTEPLVWVMIEGEDIEQITELAEELSIMLTKKFG